MGDMFIPRRQSQVVTGDDLSRNIFKLSCNKSSHRSEKEPFTLNHLTTGVGGGDGQLLAHSYFTLTSEGLSPSHLHPQPEMSVFQDLEMD